MTAYDERWSAASVAVPRDDQLASGYPQLDAELDAIGIALKPTRISAGPLQARAMAGIILAGLHRQGYQLAAADSATTAAKPTVRPAPRKKAGQ